jgi:hypothetical protein
MSLRYKLVCVDPPTVERDFLGAGNFHALPLFQAVIQERV